MDDADDEPRFAVAAPASSNSSGPAPGNDNEADSDPENEPGSEQANGGGADSSPESRGKRRRIDRYAFGFEFAPRLNPAVAAAAAAAPPVRQSPEWTEASTFALLDAWGERFVRNGRRSLRAEEWAEVARVSARAAGQAVGYYSEAQCRNRLDTLKKKYKKEKARLASYHRGSSSTFSSNWPYLDKMDALMSAQSAPLPPPLAVALPLSLPQQQIPTRRRHPSPRQPPAPQLPRLSWGGGDAGNYVTGGPSSNGKVKNRREPGDLGSDAELEDVKVENGVEDSGEDYKMLAESIRKFGEVYERMESNKRQQMLEMERMRKELQSELEARRKEILERAQAEIAKLGQTGEANNDHDDEDDDDEEDEEEEEDDNGGIHRSL